jgi:hypothetical protein
MPMKTKSIELEESHLYCSLFIVIRGMLIQVAISSYLLAYRTVSKETPIPHLKLVQGIIKSTN